MDVGVDWLVDDIAVAVPDAAGIAAGDSLSGKVAADFLSVGVAVDFVESVLAGAVVADVPLP